MAKTAAQKARRRQKRSARRAAQLPQGSRRKQPVIVVQETVKRSGGGKRKKRNRKRNTANLNRKGTSAFSMMKARGTHMVTDGLNKSAVIHNGSTIEDTFAIRREKVCNITGTTANTLSVLNQFYINPGNSVLFPIFSQIAATYEQYRVNTLVFSYETEAYTAVNSTASAGKVILATNYDPDDANFATDNQMENYSNSDRGAPYCEIIHDVLKGDHRLRHEPLRAYFVNSSANAIAPTSNSTQGKFYDLGNFQIGTQSNAAAVEIGELFVTYSFTMIRPKQQTPLGQSLLSTHYTGTATTANAFTAATIVAGSNITVTFPTALTLTLPIAGRFYMTYLVKAATSYSLSGGFTFATGATDVNTLASRNATDFSSGNGGTAVSVCCIFDYNVIGTVITFASPTIVGATVWDLLISQIPSGLSLSKQLPLTRVERLERIISQMVHRLGLTADDHETESPYDDCKEVVGVRPTLSIPATPPRWFK